jgi:Zn-dependent peptidase ImmA (M78 family)
METLKEAIQKLYAEGAKKYGIKNKPSIFLREDEPNSQMMFGRTAYYSPDEQKIVVYVTGRHPKDVLRSFCHELIHHVQNERGDLYSEAGNDPQYAQNDSHMRKMEAEAYLKGNFLLRDFEDNFKYQ